MLLSSKSNFILTFFFCVHQGGKAKGKFTLYKSSLQEYRPDTHQYCFEVRTPSSSKTAAKAIVVRAYGEQEMHMVIQRDGTRGERERGGEGEIPRERVWQHFILFFFYLQWLNAILRQKLEIEEIIDSIAIE